jgi:uncharacterized protein (TIGR00255 family)
MTGFATAIGAADGAQWVWELRSVNGRGLDVRTRLPHGLERVEVAARRRFSERLARGSVTIALQLDRAGAGQTFRVNTEQLAYYVALARQLCHEHEVAPPTADGLLALKGVIETGEPEAGVDGALDAPLLASLDEALDKLVEARLAEGARIREVLLGQLDAIEAEVGAIERHAARSLDSVRQRLASQVAELVGAGSSLSEERLAQEVALIGVKVDIREELDRLAAHVAAAREMVEAGGAIGRRLDFLCQEFNREANTICSKAIHHEITASGLALKAVIDQMREQVQNVE